METFSGDTEESTEDIPERKKSKLKSLKTRLFGRSKRAGGESNAKLSQSESDITAGKGLGSEEDLACSEGMMGSRALSHESIFLADQDLTDTEPARVLSQENVHSKIKTLQMKLQQQKMHLGPPPLVLPIRRSEDLGSRSEDDGLPHSPPEISGGDLTTQGALSKAIFQPPTRPLSPTPKPALAKPVPLTPSLPLPLSAPSNPSVVEPPMDFSSPAQFTPCLDTSAARHRMSVKPRNQRASTKKRPAADDSRSHLNTLNNINHPEPVREEEQRIGTQEAVTSETEQGGAKLPITPQRLPSKSPEVAPITAEAASKSSSLTFCQQDQALPVPSQVLRVKPHRPDVTASERPCSSFIQSELKDKGEGDFDTQAMSYDKRKTLNKSGMTEVSTDQLPTSFGSAVAFRSSPAHQQVKGETESTRGITRPALGSGSFHFSITTAKSRDGERRRSGSFVGVLEQTEARHRTEDKPFSNTREKEELRDLQPRGGSFAVGRLRQEGGLYKTPGLPWDRRDSLKKVESVNPSKNVTTNSGAVVGEGAERSQGVVDEAVEQQEVEEEEESKTAFGIKLRSTSQSTRLQSDASSKQNSKPPACEQQCDKQKRQEISGNAPHMAKELSTNISSTPSNSADLRLTDPTPCGPSLQVKHNLPSTSDPHKVQTTSSSPKEVETALAVPQEPQPPQPAPQTASQEVSWMSLAMEKTRSIQQLFTSRFPRDFTGAQTAARPQAQVQTTNQTDVPTGAQIETQTVKIQPSAAPQEAANQPSTDAVKVETVHSRSQAQTKPSPMAAQQKTPTASPIQSNTFREPQTSKQTNEPQSLPNTTVQTNARTAPSPDTSPQFAQGSVTQSLAQSYLSSGQQQSPRSNRGLHLANQPKSTTPALTSVSTTSSAPAPPPLSAVARGEREATVQEKEGASVSERRAVWAGPISEKAAILEKRAEWTTHTGTKGVELKKAQTEAQTSGESAASPKQTPLSKDTKPEGRQGVKPAESSPYKVPDRPREDRWLRKNVAPSTSPSSSPIMSSALQSMSDSGQPSWMELAKRKSMAWSDKSMD